MTEERQIIMQCLWQELKATRQRVREYDDFDCPDFAGKERLFLGDLLGIMDRLSAGEGTGA